MIAIDDVLISDDIVKKHFICDLDACKGACCWEGEWGAPLLHEEIDSIRSVWKDVEPYLTRESRDSVKKQGFGTYFGDDNDVFGTPLLKDGACVYLIRNGDGIAKCAFEKAWEDGKTAWPKPISCHLYPIRVSRLNNGTEVWNYDRWSICSAACKLGKKEKVPIYKFLKEPIIRAKGEDFYEQLDACAFLFNINK